MKVALYRGFMSVINVFLLGLMLMAMFNVLNRYVSTDVRPIGYWPSTLLALLTLVITSIVARDAAMDVRRGIEGEKGLR